MRLRVITFIAAVLVFITFLTSALFAQSSEQVPAPVAKRPTIGLVLEGGGALGLAHVGVIQWLEEHRIPVSYIAGTSMGGLVGGVYATGAQRTASYGGRRQHSLEPGNERANAVR